MGKLFGVKKKLQLQDTVGIFCQLLHLVHPSLSQSEPRQLAKQDAEKCIFLYAFLTLMASVANMIMKMITDRRGIANASKKYQAPLIGVHSVTNLLHQIVIQG